MKPYFSKLLTEQERAGSRNLSRKWGGRVRVHPDPEHDYEDEINFVSMARRRQYGYNHKEFTDVLNPLRGLLEKNVGRPWDDVYSELCKGLDRRSVTGQHVFTHLWDYVDRNTVVCVDGKIRCWSNSGGYYGTPDHFYVHPVTGILCANPDRFRGWGWYKVKENADVDYLPIWKREDGLGGEGYKRIDGLWYQVEWTKEDKFAGYHAIRIQWGKNPWDVKQEVVVLKKRQLGRKELKHLGLKNIMV